jgi:hypothetical protein
MPPDPRGIENGLLFQDTWLTSRWEVRVDVSPDSNGAPFAAIGGPLPPVREDVRTCIDTVAGRPMRIVSYRQPSGELRGEYVVMADWPLASRSWLRMGGVGVDTSAQRVLQRIVRTLAVDTSIASAGKYHPLQPCPPTDIDSRSWSSRRLRYAPVTVRMPPDAESRTSKTEPNEVLNWEHGTINFMYRVIRTPGWQLSKPPGRGAVWCRADFGGRRGEVSIDSVLPELGYPMMEARAYLELSPGVVLAIEGHISNSVADAPRQFLAVFGSIRPDSQGRVAP